MARSVEDLEAELRRIDPGLDYYAFTFTVTDEGRLRWSAQSECQRIMGDRFNHAPNLRQAVGAFPAPRAEPSIDLRT